MKIPLTPPLEVWAAATCRWVILRTIGCWRTSILAQTVLSPWTKKEMENDKWFPVAGIESFAKRLTGSKPSCGCTNHLPSRTKSLDNRHLWRNEIIISRFYSLFLLNLPFNEIVQSFEKKGPTLIGEAILPWTLFSFGVEDFRGHQIRQLWWSVAVPEYPQFLGPTQRVQPICGGAAAWRRWVCGWERSPKRWGEWSTIRAGHGRHWDSSPNAQNVVRQASPIRRQDRVIQIIPRLSIDQTAHLTCPTTVDSISARGSEALRSELPPPNST